MQSMAAESLCPKMHHAAIQYHNAGTHREVTELGVQVVLMFEVNGQNVHAFMSDNVRGCFGIFSLVR